MQRRIDWDLMHVHYQVIVVCIVYKSKVMIYLNLGYGRSPGVEEKAINTGMQSRA